MRGKKNIAQSQSERVTDDDMHWLTVVGAQQNNLRDVTVEIPLGRFVCVTGVSGSGKSSLVNDIIRETLSRDLNGATKVEPGEHDRIDGIEHLDKVIDINQSPIGRTPRSNPATYIKVFDLIRTLYAKLPDANVRGYKPGRFSFNVHTGKAGGGRCESCEGNGSNRMEMDFLADVWVTCPVCEGRRFSHETQQILFKGKSIADVLEMDVQEALDHFGALPKIERMLRTLHDVGLDYIKLGQSSTTLSGGEAQRIKLARELVKQSTGRTLYLLDEPTTGLHFADIKRLLAVLHGFVDAGNSVIVIEHNLDVVKTADWVIDLGPEGGAGGGRIVAEGTPEKVARVKRSHTGVALRPVLGLEPAKKMVVASKGNGTDLQKKRARRKDVIRVVGARQHNLKGIDVEVPRGRMTICSGPSGSGKSSFAIDTVYAEGQRRYVESLSSYARQFLGRLQPPRVDHVEGLSPAICIEQKNATKSPRSTVGTVTEIYDYMRILFARVGQPHCPKCRVPIGTQSSEEIVEKVLGLGEGRRVLLLAPVRPAAQEGYSHLFQRERANGYARVRVDGAVYSLAEPIDIDARRRHEVELVVDRIIVRRRQLARLTDSVEQALSVGEGVMIAQVVADEDSPAGEKKTGGYKKTETPRGLKSAAQDDYRFSQHHSCDECGESYEELTPHHFSFNSRMGWCSACEGLGVQQGASPASIVVHPTRSIRDGAIGGWGKLATDSKLHALALALATHFGFDLDTPWNKLSEADRMVILHGRGDEWIEVKQRKRSQRAAKHDALSGMRFRWHGFFPAINRATRSSWQYRKRLEELVTEVACDACAGGRLRPDAAAVQLGGATLHEVCARPLGAALAWFTKLKLDARRRRIAGELLHEITSRLRFLVDVGLDYVSLHRMTTTLSGGEAQRIQLASQIGTGLTGVLYVLDEPTIGLHPRDNARLIAALKRLRDLGNTLLVVEHDREVIDAADHLLDFGPGAGATGGEVTSAASPKRSRTKRASRTGQYLSGKLAIPIPSNRRPVSPMPMRFDLDNEDVEDADPPDTTDHGWLIVRGARENNLKEIDVAFPLGRFTCVTGVSGSGKSTLVSSILHPALATRLHRARLVPGGHDGLVGIEQIDKVINVDQSPIGNSPTSNAATYTGVFDAIRELFAKLPLSKIRGYPPNRFSFNRPGGRCEVCEGMGQQCIEMHFLPDVWVECESCSGTRYVPETLEVQYRGRSIADVLNLHVSDALALFANVPKVRRMMQTLEDVGLGYLPLGQAAPTLSGGEAQRVKLASELGRPSTGKTLYILDEPTTGLHFDDLKKLLSVLHRLVDAGNTCICIEHNLDVIKTADWVIDLGPEAGEDGGTIVVEGTPETVARAADSFTGAALRPVLEAGPVEFRRVHRAADVGAALPAPSMAMDGADDIRMPWERDGRHWHTKERMSRDGKPLGWSSTSLEWIVDTIASVSSLPSANWNDRAKVEIKAAGRGQWFCHILTGGQHQLAVLIRVSTGTFTTEQLEKSLQLGTLDDRTDLPIYGQEERLVVRRAAGAWNDVRLHIRDMKDIRKAPFKRFLKTAAEAYLRQFEAEQKDRTTHEPWRADPRAWHLSQQSINGRHVIKWKPVLLLSMIGLFNKLQPDLKPDWSGKVLMRLRVPGESRPAVSIVTNHGRGLRVALRVPQHSLTPTQVDRLGEEVEIQHMKEHDSIVFWVESLKAVDREQLRRAWRLARDEGKA